MIKLITTTVLVSLGFNAHADSKAEIIFKIQQAALEAGIDPDLAVAIATVESRLKPNARGALGEIGLFQLRPEYHDVKPGQIDHNIKVACEYLAELQSKFGEKLGDSFFVLYNWGPNKPPKKPRETDYYYKVMKAYSTIRMQRYLAARYAHVDL